MIRGESFTIAMVFNAEYDIETRIQDVTLSVGNITLCQLSDDTIIKSTANTLMCYISSQNTSYLQVGERAITMALTDSVNGVRKAIVAVVPVQNSGNIFENEVNNESANLVLSVTYDITNIVSDLIIADIYMGAGLPHGGVEGQHIRKVSSTNYDVEWSNQLDDITTQSFNPNVAGDPSAYVRKWDATEGTFVFGVPDGGIIQEGKELFDYYVNADTVPLVNGDIVSIVPIAGNRKAIARTDVTNATSAKNCIGMVTVASIAVGATGRVTKFGEVHDLLTSLYPDGTELFVSESNAGKWATVGATPPNYTVKIGTVIVSQNGNGIVELGIQCFPKLGDLSDVNGVSSSVNKPIVRKADGVIDAINTGLDINGITPSSGTTTITGDLSVDDITSDIVSANTVNATDLNATDIESTNGFVKTGSSDNQVLLGAGGTKNVADFQLKSEKGVANGYASLDADGLVPSAQLPSFVDDVIEVANYAALPVTGETGKIYVTLDTNKTYRWSGSTYVYITSGAVDSVAGKTGVVTLVKADVGLANVDNTSDANKPISTATQTALNGKVNNTGNETIAGIKTFSSSPIVPNPTTSGQAMNKGTADGAYVALTGNQTIAGVKTFSSSPIVPTPTNGTDAANKDYVTTSVIGAMPAATAKLAPELAYYTRVLADLGTNKDLEELTKHYIEVLQIKETAEIIWSGEAGYKLTGTKYSKVYNMATNAYDLTATVGNEFQSAGSIAPNELMRINGLTGETGTKDLIGTTKQYTSAQAFTAIIILKPNKLSATATRIYTSASNYFLLTSTAITYVGDTGNVLTATYSLAIGKFSIIELQYNNGAGLIKVNNVPVTTTASSMATTFGRLQLNQTTYNFDGSIAAFELYTGRLSESASSANYAYNRVLHPEIEGIAIGNQFIATSNYEGVVAGDGSVIGEVQPATNTELITNASDRDFSSDTGFWTKGAGTTIGGGTLNINEASAGNALAKTLLTVGKKYRVQFEILSISSGYITYAGVGAGVATSTTVGIKTYYFTATGITAGLFVGSNTVATVDNISVQDVGWSDAQLMYDNVYSYTTGSAAVKDLAATKAASFWCYYNNDALNGAIYGKLYNWWAVRLISLYPPKGWRVPTSADFTQLQTYLGGSTVAGGKLKAKYGGFNNAFSTNESGFSAIASGRRGTDGTFALLDSYFMMWTAEQVSSTDGYRVSALNTDNTLTIVGVPKISGHAIRLIRNEPVGPNERMETTGTFTTDITSTAKQLPISFGYVVDTLRIKSENALTAVEVKLHDSAGAAIATLITAKLISAGQTMVYRINAEHVAMLQDGTLRMTASGNSGSTVGVELQAILIKTSY